MKCRLLVVLTFLSPFLAAAPCEAEPVVVEGSLGHVSAKAVMDRDTVALSGEVVLTLTVEGPARLEVVPPLAPDAKPPRRLLTEASLQSWSVSDKGLPFPVEDLEGGRQRWRQIFILRPFKEGPKVEIALAPLKVKAGNSLEMEINWRPEKITIPVTTSIHNPDVQQLRPITDVEAPAATPTNPAGRKHWPIVLAVAIGAILTLLMVAILVRHGRKREPTSSYGDAWAVSQLDGLVKSGAGGATAFAQISEVLRLYLQQRFALAATRFTTAELLDSLRQTNALTGADEGELLEILSYCDVTKFAGTYADHSGPSEVTEWCERGIQFISKTKPVEPANSAQSTRS